MSEQKPVDCEPDEGVEEPETEQSGVVQGVPGRKVVVNGTLDLRGVPADQVATMKKLVVNGVLLVDEENRSALSGVKTTVKGTTVVAEPDTRVIMQSDIQFSRATLESMPPAQKLVIIGANIYFHPEVPPALVEEKLAETRIVGIVIACESVHGALMGRAEITGVSVVLEDGVRSVVRSTGHNEITEDYLSRLEDGSTYVTIGTTTISDDVTEDLLSRKIAAYHNVGKTVAPARLLNLLKTRCPTNKGSFSEPGER